MGRSSLIPISCYLEHKIIARIVGTVSWRFSIDSDSDFGGWVGYKALIGNSSWMVKSATNGYSKVVSKLIARKIEDSCVYGTN
jgi:hypothetical protein